MSDSTSGQDDFKQLFRERERRAGDAGAGGRTDDQGIAATRIVPDPIMSRQERDICLAGLLLDEEIVNERQLTSAISDWTIHGSQPLLDHLVSAGIVSRAERETLDRKVSARIEELITEESMSAPGHEAGATVISPGRLDPHDQVATLLGVNSNLAAERSEPSRRFTADYTVLRKIGQGGLGVVWLARDNSLRRFVAIKEITDSGQENPAAISRFRREAVITGRLEHPSIVPIHQFAEDLETGRTFYAMRFLGKQTLQDAIVEYHERRESGDHDPMQLHHLLAAFVSVCQAIAYAHSKDVVHRDLKPENVALDGFGQVIVLDWGLAKLIGEADLLDGMPLDPGTDSERTDRTVAGQLMGTPMYMAPSRLPVAWMKSMSGLTSTVSGRSCSRLSPATRRTN